MRTQHQTMGLGLSTSTVVVQTQQIHLVEPHMNLMSKKCTQYHSGSHGQQHPTPCVSPHHKTSGDVSPAVCLALQFSTVRRVTCLSPAATISNTRFVPSPVPPHSSCTHSATSVETKTHHNNLLQAQIKTRLFTKYATLSSPPGA